MCKYYTTFGQHLAQISSFYSTHIFSSSSSDPTSSWSQIATFNGECMYDTGAMLDDNGTVFVSFKNLTDNTIQCVCLACDLQ
jgi:hypothetical protein